ncbi:DUF1090 family protein [Pantoea rodasii]
MAERERELKEERQDGDKDKIEKRERKLEEAQHELKKLEAEPY